MALATRKQIDAAVDLKFEDVPVPEWGEGLEVRLRALSSGDRGLIDAMMVVSKGQKPEFRVDALKTLRERTVQMAMVDEDFRTLYSPKEVALLGKKSAAVIQRLYTKVQELSGLGENAIEAAEGNSEATQSDYSDSE